MENEIRLNKYIKDSGFCSRREADRLIESGAVFVNGVKAVLGTVATPDDVVEVNGRRVTPEAKKVYLAYHKPAGITCTTDLNDPTNIIDAIGYPTRIYPIGRIDKDSEGLILLTNDGDIVNRILRAGNAHQKEYVVTLDRKIDDEFLRKMSQGVTIHNTVTLPCQVKAVGPKTFNIILTQGLNRQIRLMCEALGYEVTRLTRTRIMEITLEGIPLSKYRALTPDEVASLLKATQHSSKTQEASSISGQKPQSKKNPSVRYAKRQKANTKR